MGYELFAYAIVVALMAIYVYNNERRMGEMFYKLDQTAQLQQVLLFVDTKFAEIEEKTKTKLQEAENRHKLTTDHLQKQIDDIRKLTQLQQQKLDSLDNKMVDIEQKNEMKLQDTENRNNLTISYLQKQINDMKELAQLQKQKLDSLNKEMVDIESNEIKMQDTANRNNLAISHLQKQNNENKELWHMTCEEGWRLYGEHFYYFSKNKRSWHAAKDECRRKGGHLVKVEGQAENDWLLTVWKELDLLYPWIGANDIQKTGSWKWESDQASLSYTFWGPNEPNNIQGIEHCGHFWFVKTGEWNDCRCIKSLSYICEKP